MHHAFLLLGGNTGDVRSIFQKALALMNTDEIQVETTSALYTSEAWGFSSAHTFYNQAVAISTRLDPDALLDTLLQLEKELGRTRTGAGEYTDRNIDIDLIFYDREIRDTPHLVLPHPRAHLRNFCLVPLNEIAGQYVHPVLGQTVARLLAASPDQSVITRDGK